MRNGQSLALTRGGAAGFTPASLFAAGAGGAWYDWSDLSTLFQDAARTVPVTASGQTVGGVTDKSGFGFHLSQATAAARPVYIESGGQRYLAFDGVDDTLASASPALQGLPYYIATGIDRTSVSTAGGYFTYGSNSTNYIGIVAVSTLNRLSYALRNTARGLVSGTSATNSAPAGKHFTDTYAVAGSNNYRLNATETAYAANTWNASDNVGSGLFRIGFPPAFFAENHNNYGCVAVLGRVMTAAERDDLRTWFNAKMGI